MFGEGTYYRVPQKDSWKVIASEGQSEAPNPIENLAICSPTGGHYV